MTTRNHRIRFMHNNMAAASGVTLTASGAQVGFPVSNLVDGFLHMMWLPPGTFIVTASNKNIYINDDSDKTVALTEGTYTYSTLATHIQTRLNASSTNWTCAYDLGGETFKFTIGRSSGTAVLRFSQTSNAAWDLLGFTGAVDDNSGPFVADEPRNHSEEYVVADMGAATDIQAFLVRCQPHEIFPLSSSAVIKIQANSVNSWASPPLDVTVTAENLGITKFLDDLEDTTYRYWRWWFQDRLNPLGPEGFFFSNLFLGPYTTITNRNIAGGFELSLVDPSESQESKSGSRFFNLHPKYWKIGSVNVPYISGDDMASLKQMAYELGNSTPFYASLDPLGNTVASLADLTKYVYFDREPSFRHVKYDTYALSLGLTEAL